MVTGITSGITSLPLEILGKIHQQLMDSGTSDSGKKASNSGQMATPPSREQMARQTLQARQNWMRVNRDFHAAGSHTLNHSENGDAGCLVTRRAIKNLSGKAGFIEKLELLLAQNHHIEVDFSTITQDEGRILLNVLQEQGKSNTGVLHNVRFKVDLDHSPAALVHNIDATISALRTSDNGKRTAFEFACSSHNKSRISPPDLSAYKNLTSVDFSLCERMGTGMDTALDLSNMPYLTSVNFSGCRRLHIAPRFSGTPNLTSVNFSDCPSLADPPRFSKTPEEMTSAILSNMPEVIAAIFSNPLEQISSIFPDTPELIRAIYSTTPEETTSAILSNKPELISAIFSDMPKSLSSAIFSNTPELIPALFSNTTKLTSANFSNCRSLSSPPDCWHAPELQSANFSNCHEIDSPPDFSNAKKLVSVDFSHCYHLLTPPNFSNAPNLTSADFSYSYRLPTSPDFSNNKELKWVNFSHCRSLTTLPDFSNNKKLTLANFSRCKGLTTRQWHSATSLLKRAMPFTKQVIVSDGIIRLVGRSMRRHLDFTR